MLADALDGTLSAADQATFDLHMIGCASCSTMLADAKRGAAWMEMLKSSRPEPSATLLERIIAQTSGRAEAETKPAIILGPTDRLRTPPVHTPNTLLGSPTLVYSGPAMQPTVAFTSAKVLPFRTRVAAALNFRSIGQTMLQPRLAMTAAMAFFSIALTLNLTGVRLSELRASDLKPSSIKRTFYESSAHVVRYYDNLRVVYELESRVRDLQRSTDTDAPSTSTQAPSSDPAAAKPNQKPAGDQQPDDQKPGSQNPNQNPDQKQNRPKPGPGSSRRDGPNGHLLLVDSARVTGFQPAATQAFVVFPPSVSKRTQEGGLV